MHEISPSVPEFREARRIVERSLDGVKAAFPLKTDVRVELGWGGDDFVVASLDGASGFARYPNRIEIAFNTEAERWRASLESTTVHEYAHVWVYERRGGESERKWEYVLEEAFTQHAAERIVPEYRSPWWTEYSTREVSAYWERITEHEFPAESEEAGPLFINPDPGGYPHGLGYSLSYQLGETLLERFELDRLPTVPKADLIRAGDDRYGTGR